MRYLDSLGNGNGEFELDELEQAFRRLRRECATAEAEAAGAELMERLLATVAAEGLTLRQWFATIDNGCDGGTSQPPRAPRLRL